MGVCYIQKNFKRKEVKTSPTPQQKVKPTNLRIFVGFYERSNKRNLFNVTLGHVIEFDTRCGNISSYEVPLWTFWCGISPSSLVHTQQEFYVWLFGTNWCGCQPADVCRRPQRCIALPILVREILCQQWNKNDWSSFPISNISASCWFTWILSANGRMINHLDYLNQRRSLRIVN